MSRNETQEYKARLKEITEVLRKHNITRGVPPEKLRLILEDLGSTFIKLGQIMSMHSDVLPKRYCDELMRLRSEVSPMPFSQVEETLQEAYGCPWNKIFKEIDEKPLGSASIAQVHRAVLKTGEKVVVKVQRQGIYNTMARDIRLLHRAVKLLPPVELTVEQGKVLNEELKHNIKKTVKENVNVSVKPSSPEELDELLEKMSPEQIEILRGRLDALHEKKAEEEGEKEITE